MTTTEAAQHAQTRGSGDLPPGTVKLLLDGQQRITSLYDSGGRPNRSTTCAISYGASGNAETKGKDGRGLTHSFD